MLVRKMRACTHSSPCDRNNFYRGRRERKGGEGDTPLLMMEIFHIERSKREGGREKIKREGEKEKICHREDKEEACAIEIVSVTREKRREEEKNFSPSHVQKFPLGSLRGREGR